MLVKDNQLIYPTMVNTTRMLQRALVALQRSTTHIPVRILGSRDIPVTVFGLEDDMLAWCNHANSYLTLIPNDTSDDPKMIVATVCDKCNSVQNAEGNWL